MEQCPLMEQSQKQQQMCELMRGDSPLNIVGKVAGEAKLVHGMPHYEDWHCWPVLMGSMIRLECD